MRTVPEWIGKTPGERAPDRVRQRVHKAHGGNCAICGNPIVDGQKLEIDHATALINGGENRESNLRPVHARCHKAKTAEDVAAKAKTAKLINASLRIADKVETIAGKPWPISPRTAKKISNPKPTLPPRPMFAPRPERIDP